MNTDKRHRFPPAIISYTENVVNVRTGRRKTAPAKRSKRAVAVIEGKVDAMSRV
jgi:hypothetical protein